MRTVVSLALTFSSLVLASNHHGFLQHSDYLYKFETQILSGSTSVEDTKSSGIYFSSNVIVQSLSRHKVSLSFSNFTWAKFNAIEISELDKEGWMREDNMTNYNQEPFPTHLNGAMTRPIVVAFEKGNFVFLSACKRDSSVTTNIKKAFVQLIQMDLENVFSASKNVQFEKVEPLLTGKCQTTYEMTNQSKDMKKDHQNLHVPKLQNDGVKEFVAVRKLIGDCEHRPQIRQYSGFQMRPARDSEIPENSESVCFLLGDRYNFTITSCSMTTRYLSSDSAATLKSSSQSRISLVHVRKTVNRNSIPTDTKVYNDLSYDLSAAHVPEAVSTHEIVSAVYELREKLFEAAAIASESALLLPEMSVLAQLARRLNRQDLESIRLTLATDADHAKELLNVFYSLVSTIGSSESVAFFVHNIDLNLMTDFSKVPELYRSAHEPKVELLRSLISLTKKFKVHPGGQVYYSSLSQMSSLLFRMCYNPSVVGIPELALENNLFMTSKVVLNEWIPFLESELESVRTNSLWDESYSYALVRSLGLLGNLKSAHLILENAEFFSESLEAFSLQSLRTTAKVHTQNIKKILMKVMVDSNKSDLVRFSAIDVLMSTKPTLMDVEIFSERLWGDGNLQMKCYLQKLIKLKWPDDQDLEILLAKFQRQKSKCKDFENLFASRFSFNDFSFDHIFKKKFQLEGHLLSSYIFDSRWLQAESLELLANFYEDRSVLRPSQIFQTNYIEDYSFHQNETLTNIFLSQSTFGYEFVTLLNFDSLRSLDLMKDFSRESPNKYLTSHAGNLFAVQKFVPSNAGFLLFEKNSVDYFAKVSITLGAGAKVNGREVTFGFNACLNREQSIGVIIPFDQRSVSWGQDSRIVLNAPKFQVDMDIRGSTDVSAAIRPFTTTILPLELLSVRKTMFTKSNSKQSFNPLINSQTSFDTGKLFGLKLILDVISTDLDQETLSCDIIDGIFRRDLSLVYHPFQSNLREVELSFKASEREFSIGQSQSESFSNEDAIRRICTDNYPRSYHEFEHCFKFLTDLEKTAMNARGECHKKTFPNEKARNKCHRTADICELAFKFCSTDNGPRTRRCHRKANACKMRFKEETDPKLGLYSIREPLTETVQWKLAFKELKNEKVLMGISTKSSNLDENTGLSLSNYSMKVSWIENGQEFELSQLLIQSALDFGQNATLCHFENENGSESCNISVKRSASGKFGAPRPWLNDEGYLNQLRHHGTVMLVFKWFHQLLSELLKVLYHNHPEIVRNLAFGKLRFELEDVDENMMSYKLEGRNFILKKDHVRIPDSFRMIFQMLSSNSDLIDQNKNKHQKNCSPLPDKCCCSFKDQFNICPVFCKFILAADPGDSGRLAVLNVLPNHQHQVTLETCDKRLSPLWSFTLTNDNDSMFVRNVADGEFLATRINGENEDVITSHEPEYQAQWKFESISGQGFRLKSVSSERYLCVNRINNRKLTMIDSLDREQDALCLWNIFNYQQLDSSIGQFCEGTQDLNHENGKTNKPKLTMTLKAIISGLYENLQFHIEEP